MPALIWLLLLGGAGAAVALKSSPGAFAGWKRIDSAKAHSPAAAALVALLKASEQNAVMTPDGKLMAVRNGDIVEVYERS